MLRRAYPRDASAQFVPRTLLTDISVRALKSEKRTDFWDTKLPSFGVRVGPRTKTFIVKRDNSRITIGAYPDMSLQEARKVALKHKASSVPKASIPFGDALAQFIAQGQWRPRSRYEITRTLNKHFNWTKTLDKITHRDVDAAIAAIDAKSEAAHAFKDIRAFFNWCVPRYIPHSPCAGLKSPSRYVPRDRLLTDREIVSIWNASGELGDYGLQVRRLVLTGQRVNQIFSLQPEWVDPVARLITFPAAVMKNNVKHRIPYGTLTETLLAEFPAITSQGKMKRRLEKLAKVSEFTLHDFRRYFSSTHARLRTPIDITEALLAHVSGSRSPIQRIYDRHDRLEEMRQATRRWEEHLVKLLTVTTIA